ncbi:hypothetical protein GCM10010082_11910 [Kushneria pakistanensis]|uniref:Calcineurin-like phosphoesterase domain-containing protein n=1 Tax=Kushneria pakistanensis TaxID=1508770 RepID=A0ABQ3FEY8_9GAMM|nr:hypothetical protein [Kushneria pakistanensis]GHC21743.1 hypothetical protein GCM10010082_11910 [Kushneria pakistanensis]
MPSHDYLGREGFIQYTLEAYPVRLIGLDTLVSGEGHGELCTKRLIWLAARLAEQPTRPTLLFMHHPPFVTGIDHMDAKGLTGAHKLEALVRDYPNIERILCGHVHRPIFRRFGGTIASCCPSTAHQSELNLAGHASAAFVMEPPGYQLHLWKDGALITHTGVMGTYDGPYAFRTADRSIEG